MDYEDGVEKLFPIVKEVWQKVDSGFYPEIGEEVKLLTIQKRINDGYLEEGFWDLVRFLIIDLLAISEEDLAEERKRLAETLKKLDDQTTVQQWIEKLKAESQTGDKAIGIIESLQQNIF